MCRQREDGGVVVVCEGGGGVVGYKRETPGSGGSRVRESLGQEGRLCGPPRGAGVWQMG